MIINQQVITTMAIIPILMGIYTGFIVYIIIFLIIIYIYTAIVLMKIAQKRKIENAWLAWIPIANVYLMTQIADVSPWYTAAILLGIIPMIGPIAMLAIFGYLWWKIAEKLNRPGYWGILIVLIPIVNFILLGMLAWSDN